MWKVFSELSAGVAPDAETHGAVDLLDPGVPLDLSWFQRCSFPLYASSSLVNANLGKWLPPFREPLFPLTLNETERFSRARGHFELSEPGQ